MGRVTVGLIVTSWVIPISLLVNHIVPHPYMDEIFHIPQAQQYCKADFWSWDPMITTPPGLYYLSLAHVASLFPGMYFLRQASSLSDLCSTAILRSVNGALAILCSILVYEIITNLKPALDRKKATFFTVVLSLYPLHWFFTFLFYTDLASLAAFLAMYLTSLKKKFLFSALLGAVAVSIRQTNIIWMLFVACSSVIEMLLVQRRNIVHKPGVPGLKSVLENRKNDFGVKPGLRRRKHLIGVPSPDIPSGHEAATSKSHMAGLIDEMMSMLISAWHLKWELLISFSPFILVLGSFVAFVYWNGSIVLGAKEAHSVSLHFAQIMYFALVSVLFSVLFHLNLQHCSSLFQSLWKSRPLSFTWLLGAFAGVLVSVHFFSIAHPYLLADNRHYTFYIWRKIINAHRLMKYLLTPFYVFSWLSILAILGKVRTKIWVLAYFLACVAVLVPTPLIEFRYYTIPFFIFMLNCEIEDSRKWVNVGVLFIGINVFTLYMFLYRPFYWTHEPGVQRFIW